MFKIIPLLKMILISSCSLIYGIGNSQSYNFPIKAGTKEWMKIQTHDDMIRACKIPDDSLKNISTSRLIETCLSYPLMMDMLAFDNPKNGFINTYSNFNGFQELVGRGDVDTQLFDKFIHELPQNIETIKGDIDRGSFTFRFTILEMMLSHDPILNKLDYNQQSQLIIDLIAKSEAKAKSVEYGWIGQIGLTYLLAKVLDKQKLFPSKNNQLQIFIDQMIVSEQSTVVNIFTTARQVSNH